MSPLLPLLMAALFGATVGCGTGLLPGLHVNTLSVLLLATAPLAWPALEGVGIPPDLVPLVLAAFVLGMTVSHTFVNIVPATYLGAPDESTALMLLPAHRMLLRGHGYRAVHISSHASFWAVALSLLLLLPARWVLIGPFHVWDTIREHLLVILFGLVAFLVLREPARFGPTSWGAFTRRAMGRLSALALFLTAGVYGLFSFRLPYESFVPLPPSPLLPMLSGLFGAATLLEALQQTTKIPHQFLRLRDDALDPQGATAALGVGVAAGAAMSLFPGLTNTTATAAASSVRRARNDAEILVSLGAVNTANAVFNLLILAMFDRARSGAVVALDQLSPLAPWTAGPAPPAFVLLLFVTLAAALASLLGTLVVGKWAARRIHRIPYRPLVAGVLVYVVAVVVVFTGGMGLLVFLVGAAIGTLPVRAGLQRTHLTGVLLGPVLVYLGT